MCDYDNDNEMLTLPDGMSISDLCDCGHHKRKKFSSFPIAHQRGKGKTDTFETAYRSTFRENADVRPRSSKRPPPSPRDLNPPPMTFDTNQRSQYRPFRDIQRAQIIRQDESYDPPTEPLENRTSYRTEFTAKEIFPDTVRSTGPRGEMARKSSAKFVGTSTTKEHFKQWVAQPTLAFQELPSFAGSILFPGKNSPTVSTFRHSYAGKYVPPLNPSKTAQDSNITMEGDMDLITTHRNAYKQYDVQQRTQRFQHKSHIDKTLKSTRGKFSGETQTKHDFGGFKLGYQPLPPSPIDPPKPMISLEFDNRRCFETEQRSTYRGHDTRRHAAAKSCKKDSNEYIAPSVKFETITSQKRDFLPIDLDEAFCPRASRPAPKLQSTESKFEGTTMNNVFFRDWGAQVTTRPRYGDFHENHTYIPPTEPFSGQSTTRCAYTPKEAGVTVNYKPNTKPKTKEGEFDFGTEYSKSYTERKPKMCKAQAYLMKKELERRQVECRKTNIARSLSVK